MFNEHELVIYNVLIHFNNISVYRLKNKNIYKCIMQYIPKAMQYFLYIN